MDNADRPRPAERLAGVGDLPAGQRHSDPSELHGRRGKRRHLQPPTSARPTSSAGPAGGNGLAPVYTCDPATGGTGVGEKILDLNCIGFPDFGTNGELVPPYNIRTPTRYNHDLTLFKNFAIKGDQKIQFRVGFFNLFNQAFANTNIANDINLTLDTVCKVTVNHVPNGTGGFRTTSATRPKGFDFTPQTKDNFGKINLLARSPRDRVRPEVLLLEPRTTRMTLAWLASPTTCEEESSTVLLLVVFIGRGIRGCT